ncbi:FAD/NAD(P)-binding domain-containing protein [Athelia psychrophila]|uniref:FAD/NAD(P)-binding domain-containing protein n=1 Tax=Athelia psychrophila TaxID=1759441 RepID=A0A166UNE6_9AGAM|nr:FAD/NAD(P)-binding domain-containing protein [Fibularhizoctonia sp. CBS 109695]
MSTKTLAVLPAADLQDGKMKQVDFDGGKVLLSRLGPTIHATSAFCTHYGAPLAGGVLTADARVVCPWHGACFSVKTGDIEDAPAPSPIHSFKAFVKDGQIHVTADPAKTQKPNIARAPGFVEASSEKAGAGVIIVGGGSAAFHAVESLREHGYVGAITLLSREPHAPIDRTKLSKALVTDASKIEWRSAADLKIKYGANLRTGVDVTKVDTDAQTVTLRPIARPPAPGADNAETPPAAAPETIAYTTLILAPGSAPRRLPIPGADAPNVLTFRGVADAKAADTAAQKGKNVVVIGASFIAMELVGAIAKRELGSLHVVGTSAVPFQAVLGEAVGRGLQGYYVEQGVQFHMSARVESIEVGEDGAATGVKTGTETIPADVVVLGVGVVPDTRFLQDSGFALEKDGGIKVDGYLRVPGKKGVYAVGDIAAYPQVGGVVRRVEHWNVAGNHGRAVGRTIALEAAGKGAEGGSEFRKVPIFWSAQGLRYCGSGAGFDDVIVTGDPGALKFIAYYVKAGKVVAVCTMQNDPVVSQASELLRLGLMPTPEEIRGGRSLLEVDISSEKSEGKFACTDGLPKPTSLQMVSDYNPARKTLGPFLLGDVAALALYGVELAQMYHYLRRAIYVKPWIKCLIFSLFFLETFQIMVISCQLYETLVVFRTDILVTEGESWHVWTMPLEIILTGSTAFIAQLYFVWTVHVVIRKRLLTYTIFFFSASGFMASIAFGVTSIYISQFSQRKRLDGAIATWLASALIADTLAAFSLARYLGKRRCNQFSSGDAVSRFISMSLATAMITSLASIVCLVIFVSNGPQVNLAFACVYGKLYMNSVLSILNSRLYEDPDNSETPSSVSGLQLTSIALGATWATKASKQ